MKKNDFKYITFVNSGVRLVTDWLSWFSFVLRASISGNFALKYPRKIENILNFPKIPDGQSALLPEKILFTVKKSSHRLKNECQCKQIIYLMSVSIWNARTFVWIDQIFQIKKVENNKIQNK